MTAVYILLLGICAMGLLLVSGWLPAEALRHLGIAVLLLGLAAIVIAALWQKRKNGAIYRLHEQAQDFLENRRALPFSVEDNELSLLENDMAEIAYRLLLERHRTLEEGKKTAAFVADISHQLKTPLASLKLHCELQLEDSADSRTEKQLVLIQRMEELIYSLLRLEKLKTGAYEMRFETWDLRELICRVCAELQVQYPDRHFDIAALPLFFRCDGGWIQEMLQNILKNGCEHTKPGGGIRVVLDKGEGMVEMTIQDDGGGVPDSELPRLFERYYRSSRSNARQGAGIGLAIAKTVAEKHHGTVTAENAEKGLRVMISLPILEGNLAIS